MSQIAKNESQREIRVLVADDDVHLCERLVDFLSNNGFYARAARNGLEVKNILLTWKPDFIIIDLMLAEMNALEVLKYLGQQNLGEDKIRVIVLSGHSQESNVRESLKYGALDYLVKPLKYVDLLARLVLHSQKKRSLQESENAIPAVGEPDATYYMHLTDLILREALKNRQIEETLFYITQMVSMALKAVRVSVVQCDTETRSGSVVGSSDLRHIQNLHLDLNKYPEILYVLYSQKMLALDNLAKDPTMAFVRQQNKSISFNSMIVAPIRLNATDVWGVISARMPDSKTSLTDSEIRFMQMVSHIVGLALLKNRAPATGSSGLPRSA